MKQRIKRRKHTYWHTLARTMLEYGFKPTIVGHIVNDTEVNGRHIGAYKRGLIKDGEIEVPSKPTMNRNEASQLAKGMVSTEDMFIYRCMVGSTKRTLRCFEYKFKAEDNDVLKEVDKWLNMVHTAPSP